MKENTVRVPLICGLYSEKVRCKYEKLFYYKTFISKTKAFNQKTFSFGSSS